jgi:DNA-binding MarR family transcriptional regulator
MNPLTVPPETLPAVKTLPVLLRHSWYALNQAFRRRIAHLGLTPDQFTVLRNLAEEPGLTQRDLCQRMASDPNTVAALTARMAAEGWIERKACDKDRRANRLRLLPQGKRKLAAAKPLALELQEEVSRFVDPDEFRNFLDCMSKLAASCREALRDSPPPPGSQRQSP